jgi:Phosphatidate cytidylyltransferase, mitochondrial
MRCVPWASRERAPVAASTARSTQLGAVSSVLNTTLTLPEQLRQRLVAALVDAPSPASDWVPKAVARTVAASSRRQAVAGLIGAGPYRGLAYLSAKMSKRLRALVR